MDTKEFTVFVKAVSGDEGTALEAGQFEAIVSVFGNVDSVGDVVVKGAFADDLKRWKDSGDPIPIVWSHRWEDPFAHVGYVLDAKETDEGLWIKGQLDFEGNPTAAQVHRLLKGRRVTQFSFAYDVLEGESVTKDGSHQFELRKLKTYEVGPCLVGANQETSLLAAKAAALGRAQKAGRVLSAKNLEGLKTARAAIDDVIRTQEAEDEDEKTTTTTVPGTEDGTVDHKTSGDDSSVEAGGLSQPHDVAAPKSTDPQRSATARAIRADLIKSAQSDDTKEN